MEEVEGAVTAASVGQKGAPSSGLSASQSKSKKPLSSSQKSNASTRPAASTSASSASQPTQPNQTEKRERVACDLSLIYPVDEPGAEYSWEEVRARKYVAKRREEGESEWEREARETRRWHRIEADGKPLLYDPSTGGESPSR